MKIFTRYIDSRIFSPLQVKEVNLRRWEARSCSEEYFNSTLRHKLGVGTWRREGEFHGYIGEGSIKRLTLDTEKLTEVEVPTIEALKELIKKLGFVEVFVDSSIQSEPLVIEVAERY